MAAFPRRVSSPLLALSRSDRCLVSSATAPITVIAPSLLFAELTVPHEVPLRALRHFQGGISLVIWMHLPLLAACLCPVQNTHLCIRPNPTSLMTSFNLQKLHFSFFQVESKRSKLFFLEVLLKTFKMNLSSCMY